MGFYSTGQAAKKIGIKQYQLLYLVSTGKIPDSLVWVAGKRAWSEREVQAIADKLKELKSSANDSEPQQTASGIQEVE